MMNNGYGGLIDTGHFMSAIDMQILTFIKYVIRYTVLINFRVPRLEEDAYTSFRRQYNIRTRLDVMRCVEGKLKLAQHVTNNDFHFVHCKRLADTIFRTSTKRQMRMWIHVLHFLW